MAVVLLFAGDDRTVFAAILIAVSSDLERYIAPSLAEAWRVSSAGE